MPLLRTALVVGTLLAAAAVTARAQASNRFERSEEDYFAQIEHPCNGELVTLVGTLTVTTRRTVDANGIVHLSSTDVSSIHGEGPSGEYVVRDVDHVNDKFIDNEFFPENITTKLDFHMVGKGQAPNFLVTLNMHFPVEADGTVRVEFTHEVVKCTGKN